MAYISYYNRSYLLNREFIFVILIMISSFNNSKVTFLIINLYLFCPKSNKSNFACKFIFSIVIQLIILNYYSKKLYILFLFCSPTFVAIYSMKKRQENLEYWQKLIYYVIRFHLKRIEALLHPIRMVKWCYISFLN